MPTIRGLFSHSCINCGGASGHPPIEDDGYRVCYPCILRGTRESQDAAILSRAYAEWENEVVDEHLQRRLDDIRADGSVGYWMHVQYHHGRFPGCHYCDRTVAA